MERFSDELDWAKAVAEAHDRACVEEARRAAQPEQVRGPDGEFPVRECVDCGEPIEPERIEAGRVRCFECQSTLEQRAKQYWR